MAATPHSDEKHPSLTAFDVPTELDLATEIRRQVLADLRLSGHVPDDEEDEADDDEYGDDDEDGDYDEDGDGDFFHQDEAVRSTAGTKADQKPADDAADAAGAAAAPQSEPAEPASDD